MIRRMLRSKIHRATVTHADVHYEGSITVPPYLMEAAGLLDNEAVSVWNVSNGNRFETYAITGESGNNSICVNGAAAHLANPGELVIISCFVYLEDEEAQKHEPTLVFVDAKNQIRPARPERPGPAFRASQLG